MLTYLLVLQLLTYKSSLKKTTTITSLNLHKNWHYAARSPGSWANDLKICTIDGAADQRIAIGTEGLSVGFAVTAAFSSQVANTDGTVGVQTGYLKGIITGSMLVLLMSKLLRNTTFLHDVWTKAELRRRI